jgi:hypothetical protein
MLGSIQSRRCHLWDGLVAPAAAWPRADPGRRRSRRDWAMDSDLLGIGGVHGLGFSFDAFLLPTVASFYAAFPRPPALWFSW